MVGNLAGRGEGERGAGWIRLHDGGCGHPVPYREELRARPGQSQAFLFSHMSSLLFSDIRVVKLMNINYYHNVPFERRPSEPPHGAGRLHRNAVLSSCDLEKDYLQWPVITKMKCRNFNPHVWRFPGCWQRRDEISLFKSKLATSSPFASNLGLGFLPRSRPKMKTGKRGKNLPVESIETDGGELNF